MRLKSYWDQGDRVFWRIYDPGDTVYIIGYREGLLPRRGIVEVSPPAGQFQIMIKEETLFGRTLVTPGRRFNNDDELILTSTGTLGDIYDVSEVSIDSGIKVAHVGSTVQFFEAASTPFDVTVSSQLSVDDTQITSTATRDAPTMTAGVGPLTTGITVNGSVSPRVVSKIDSSIQTQLRVRASAQTTFVTEQRITVPANKFVAIITGWQKKFITGRVTIEADFYDYSAIINYIGSLLMREFESPDSLPPDLMAHYLEYNFNFLPASYLTDGSLLRERSSDPVYVIFGGAKFHVPDTDFLHSYYGGWNNVKVVADGALLNVPIIPRDGTILREAPDPEVWLIEGGKRRHIVTTRAFFRYGGENAVRTIPDNALDRIPIGPVIRR